jgi:hypothetical protein
MLDLSEHFGAKDLTASFQVLAHNQTSPGGLETKRHVPVLDQEPHVRMLHRYVEPFMVGGRGDDAQ